MEKFSGINNLNGGENKIKNKRNFFVPQKFLGKGFTIIEQGSRVPDSLSINYEKVILETFSGKEENMKNKKIFFRGRTFLVLMEKSGKNS
jgi:hypothetical protein